ncbi:MAG: cell wall hydrolase [Vulcanibacillus sp.]
MKSYIKNLGIFILVFIILFSFTSIDAKASSLIVKLNGTDVSDIAEAVLVDGRTYIPVRAFTELLGYQVSWDSKLKEATVTDYINTFKFYIDSKKVNFNESTLYMDSRALIINGRTYAPVRFVTEIFGYKVFWDSNTSTVNINEIPSYIVEEGDTLFLISEKLGIGIDSLMSWNQLNSDIINVGDKLYLEKAELNALDELKTNAVINYTDEELDWLAKIIYTEARDEPYEGLVAVGAVVVNRVESSRFPNEIYDVIFQKNQFTPVTTGLIYKIVPNNASYKAAEEALMGNDPTNGALFFNNPRISVSTFFSSKEVTIRIGNHSFYR